MSYPENPRLNRYDKLAGKHASRALRHGERAKTFKKRGMRLSAIREGLLEKNETSKAANWLRKSALQHFHELKLDDM